jgi:23S rRNA (adenine2503-C2)-methyltransferase
VLWEGVNDSDEDARRLARLLGGLPAHVNLIPHNAYEGTIHRPPDEARLLRFQGLVREDGVRCLIRRPRGHDIRAACGQLAGGREGGCSHVRGPRPW